MGKNNKIKTLVFDGDGTLWNYNKSDFGSSWEAVSNALGYKKETDELTKKYYHKRGKDPEWVQKQINLFRGGSVDLVKEKVYPIPYSNGVIEFFDFISKRKDLRKGILSTGLNIIVKKAKQELNMDFCFCNSLYETNGYFNGKFFYKVPLWKKHCLFESCCNGHSLEQAAYIGDGENDIKCMKEAGVSVAFSPREEEVKEVADFVIDDFRELIKILGLN